MRNFKEFFESIKDKSKNEKGIEFEKYCLEYLIQVKHEDAYRYEDYAKNIDKTLPSEDCGVDIIIKKGGNTFQIVPCKFKGDKKPVSVKALGTTFTFKFKYRDRIINPLIVMCTSEKKSKIFR